ncbi:MAG: hypothetical protein V3S98_00670 [Dehalococcoidia bacterium]
MPQINPFTLPEDQKGWRGMEVHGKPRRRVFSVLENEHVIVTALMQLPGEPGVRHSHESGELSFRWAGDMTPFVTWHPGGEWHGGAAEVRTNLAQEVTEALALLRDQLSSGSAETAALLSVADKLQEQINTLQHQQSNAKGPAGGPGLIIDCLFPPFKTTIDDPNYPEVRTITGQWYD